MRACRAVAVVVALLVLVLAARADAQAPSVPVLEPYATDAGSGAVARTGGRDMPMVVRPRPAAARELRDGARRLRLPLPGGREVIAARRDVASLADGGTLWAGTLEGIASGRVLLVSRGDVMAGLVETGDRTFALLPSAGAGHLLADITTDVRACGGGRVAAAGAPGRGDPAPSVPLGSSLALPAGEPPPVVDLLVVFTPDARIAAGGEAAMLATIDLAVAVTNQALDNSAVAPRVRLVDAREVAYTESRILSVDLDRLTTRADGVMDDVHALRDAIGADLVSLIVERNTAGLEGLGWLMQNPSASFESLAFSVVMRRTAATLTLAHEIGHNLGLNHDRANASAPGAYPYAYGYRDPPYFRDVMSYACPGTPCPLVSHFSNPDVVYAGRPTGRADSEDNARALRQTMPVAAQFRGGAGPVLTMATPATVTTLGDASVTLSGTRLSTVSRVRIGSADATSFGVTSSGTLAVVVPRRPQGPADVVVEDAEGRQSSLPGALAFVPSAADVDGDALEDDWERTLGLRADGTAGDGADGDPDGDGVSNLRERLEHGHPLGRVQRYFAEGASTMFFSTQLALLNPADTATGVVVRYPLPDGTLRSTSLRMPPRSRRTVAPADVDGVAGQAFSIVVESESAVVADRLMWWDATGYGAHAETSLSAPATTWYLAEGATTGSFNLFYLLQNPNPVPASVRVRYLRADDVPLERLYTLPPTSRTNIWVNQEQFPGLGQALASAEVSAIIESLNAQPIVVERAMYLDRAGQAFAAGHGSAAVAEPALEWYFAEGATGPWFDLFLLVANPSPDDALVEATYLLPDGRVVTKRHTVPARRRSTIWVDQEDVQLSDTAVSSILRVLNGVPVVAERAMWWPGDSRTWYEAHASAGVGASSARWAMAEGEVGGPRGVETYILIGNTSPTSGTVNVTLLLENGETVSRSFDVAARSRLNVDTRAEFPEAIGRRFGVLVESGPVPLALVVERAMYWDAAGRRWAAGSNAGATRLP